MAGFFFKLVVMKGTHISILKFTSIFSSYTVTVLFSGLHVYLSDIVKHGYSSKKGQWSRKDESHNQKHCSKCNMSWEAIAIDTDVEVIPGTLLN